MKLDAGRVGRLRSALEHYPTVDLLDGPTPLQQLPHLSAELGIDLWMKRDDLTPLGLGGDKARKLEYELAQAIEAGADVIVTSGSAQSNHARLTSAAARKLGLDVVLVLSKDRHAQMQGNLLTVHLMGGEVVMIETEDHWDLDDDVASVSARLRGEGRVPHVVPVSGTTPHSCLGYINGGLELLEQLSAAGTTPDVIYTPFGTGGIFTAYLYALRSLGLTTEMVGISVNRPRRVCERNVEEWWHELDGLLGGGSGFRPDRFVIDDGYVGREYGDATHDSLEAIVRMARGEGILLDPVYSGKVFAGLLGHAASGDLASGASVVMLHSGGFPATFAYHAEIATHLEDRSG